MSTLDRTLLTLILIFAALLGWRESDFLQRQRQRQPDIVISVSGAVAAPGVIQLPAGARAVHAIDECGGLLADADAGAVPLALLLEDGQNLVVPCRATPPEPATDKEPEAARLPVLAPPAGPDRAQPLATPTHSSHTAPVHQPAPAEATPAEPIDLNGATAEELEGLPGVGPVMARRILEARQAMPGGSFGSLEELGAIRGIKGKTFQRLKPYLKIEGS